MSTSWGLRCETCCADSPLWCRRSWPVIEVVINWDAIAKLRKTQWIEVNISLYVGDEPSIYEFMEQHCSHSLALLNGYGDTEPIQKGA